MDYFHKERYMEIGQALKTLEVGIGFMSGVLASELHKGKNITVQANGLSGIISAKEKITEAMRRIICWEMGAAYYDYTHQENTKADETTLLGGYFDDGFERAHENSDTEQECTYTAFVDIPTEE